MIGRHARDHPGKWLEAEDEFLATYPEDDPGIRVRILGGSASVAARLGHAPTGWDVLPFGLGGVADDLASLDAFVNFASLQHHEAFGRTVVEAALAGRPAHFAACSTVARAACAASTRAGRRACRDLAPSGGPGAAIPPQP